MVKTTKFKETEIGMIPEDWEECRWGDLVILEYGKGLKGYRNSSGQYRVFGTNGPIGWNNEPLCTYPTVIVGRKGAYRGIHYSPKPCFAIDTAFYLSPKTEFDMLWAYYELLTQDINGMDSGSAIPSTSRDSFYQLMVKLPPLIEQSTIAKVLSDLDAKIELNNEMNKTLEAIGQAIFKHWFIDFEFPNENGQPYKSSGGEMVFNKELDQEIPKEWKVGSIYEIADVIYGAPFSSKMFNKEKEGLPLIRIRDLKDCNPLFYTTENHPKGTIINAGDIVAGMDAEFRPHIWLGEKSYLNQRLCYFRPKNNIHKYFILNTIKPLLSFFKNAKVGTTVIHLGKSDIDTWRIVIPDNKTNNQFFELITGLFNQIVNNSIEASLLSQIRDSLLPRLMSGKIRVGVVS